MHPPTQDFQALLDRAREQDPQALEDLTSRYYPEVERMVHRDLSRDLRRNRPWLAHRFSTGDVVQEVFRDLIKDLSGFLGTTERAFCGYLAMLVRNRLLDAIRYHQAAQRDGRRTALLGEGAEFEGADVNPAAEVDTRERVAAVDAVLQQFPERERLLLRERFEHDTGFQELAERLGYASKWAARRAFYAAQARLAIQLRQRDID